MKIEDSNEENQNLFKPQEPPKSNLLKAITLGVQFLLMFSAFNSAQNMVGQLYQQAGQKNLGTISILFLYLVLGIASIFAPNISAKFNPKWVLLVSSFGYTLFIGSGMLVSICEDQPDTGLCSSASKVTAVLIGACLCGLGASTLWVSQAWYISNISSVATRGLYYGIFWACMQSSQISGNILSAVLLHQSHNIYFITMAIICLVSGLSFSLLPSIEINEEVKPFWEKVRETLNLLKNMQMRPLLVYFFFAGSAVSFYTGFLYKIVQNSLPLGTSDKEINEKTSYVYICLGFFEFLGGIISGFLADRVNRYLIATFSTIIVEAALVISIIGLYQESYYLCFVSGALWGLADCVIQNMCTVIISTLFPGSIEAFAINRIMQGVSITTFMIVNIFLKEEIAFVLIITGIQILMNLVSSQLGVNENKAVQSK